MSDLVGLAFAIALLMGNAFFVGAEFALISARRSQIEPAAEAGSRSARITLRAMDHVALMMAGAQLGITVCSLALGAIAEPTVAHFLEVPLEAVGVPSWLLHPIAFTVALAIITYFHMVIGEMVPKNIAIAGPERSARILGPIIFGIVFVLKPVILLLNWICNLVLRLVKVTPQDEVTSTFTANQVADFITESGSQGLLDESEHQLLSGAVAISSESVSQVAVPLEDVIILDAEVTVAEAEATCARTGFSRFPIRGSRGELDGYVHVKDLIGTNASEFDRPVPQRWIRTLIKVDSKTSLEETLTRMQQHGAHMAEVTGGSGSFGVTMLQNVVERLIGDTDDEAQRVRSSG